MYRGIGDKETARYMVVLDTPEKLNEFLPIFSKALQEAGLDRDEWYISFAVRDLDVPVGVASARLYQKHLDADIHEANIEKAYFLGNAGIGLVTEGTIRCLKNNRRRWERCESGTSFQEWFEENSNRQVTTFLKNGDRTALKKLELSAVKDIAAKEHYVVDRKKPFWAMSGVYENTLYTYPEFVGVLAKDLAHLAKFDTEAWEQNTLVVEHKPLEEFYNDRVVCIDTETNAIDRRELSDVGVISVSDGTHAHSEPTYGCELSDEFRKLLEGHEGRKIGYNFKYDLHVLKDKFGVDIKPPYEDVLMLVHLVAPHLDEKGLKQVTRQFLPMFPEHDKLLEQLKVDGKLHDERLGRDNYLKVPYENLKDYCEGDTVATHKLREKLLPMLTPRQRSLYYVECKFLEIIYEMEQNGFYVDKELWVSTKEDYRGLVDQYHAELKDYADINWNSTQQVKEVLDFLPNVQEATLEKYAGESEIIPVLLDYKKAGKIFSTYLEKMPNYCVQTDNPKYWKILYNLNQDGTRTGRLSSSKPNMQNFPKKGPVRNMFVSRYGKNGKIVDIDASQIEYRFMAFAARDQVLIDAYNGGSDMHQVTADLFGIDRSDAKTVNFALLYIGNVYGGAYKLQEMLGISKNKALAYTERYFRQYHAIMDFCVSTREQVWRDGYVESMFGRKRFLGFANDKYLKSKIGRQAVNTKIQGVAVDYVKASLNYLWAKMDDELREGCKFMVTIHDDILVDCKAHLAERFSELAQHCFRNPNDWSTKLFGVTFDIPFEIGCAIGDSWGGLNDIDL